VNHSAHWLSTLDPRLPKYKAVYQVIASAIASGHLGVGDKLPPRRLLAKNLSVTVDTVSRAFDLLTRQQLVASRVGDGTYVRERNEFASQAVTMDLSQNHPSILNEDLLLAATLSSMAKYPDKLAFCLNYQEDTGYEPHHASLARWLHGRGLPLVDPERVIMTSGGQHSLYLTLRALLPSGSSVMAEEYTYPVLRVMANWMRLQMLPIPMDSEGLIPSELERVQRSTGARALFCQPSCHNPTTATMSGARRIELARLARERDLLVIENITQAMFMDKQPKTIFELAPERTVLIGSFSKMTSPGLRVGFVVTESRKGARIAAYLRLSCWMPCLLGAEVVARWIESGQMGKLLEAKRRDLRLRHELVGEYFKGLDYQSDIEQNFIWLHLPKPWEARTLTGALQNEGLVVRGAQAFTFGRTRTPNASRLSLGTPQTIGDLERALGTMSRILRAGPP
jgi:DNA-binding transcriptional MocR family regulator